MRAWRVPARAIFIDAIGSLPYGLSTTLVATKVRAPLTLNSGPRTETTLETGTSEMFMDLLFSEKIVGAEVCASIWVTPLPENNDGKLDNQMLGAGTV